MVRVFLNWRNNLSFFKIIASVLLICHSFLSSYSEAGEIVAEDVYQTIKENPVFDSVIITDQFDLTMMPVEGEKKAGKMQTIRFDNVIFKSPVLTKGNQILANIIFINCKFHSMIAPNLNWVGDLIFEGCVFEGPAFFKNSEFESNVKFHNVRFNSKASFRNAIFKKEVEFLNCIFGDQTATNSFSSAIFSNANFNKTVRFNYSQFQSGVNFQATGFEDDVSFIKINIEGNGYYRNVMFKGDAEFRFANMSNADFGDESNMTVFFKHADFRGAGMQSAKFRYVDFKQIASFADARIGKEGASFENATFSGSYTNMEGLNCEGPLELKGAYIRNLLFNWEEIGEAILQVGGKGKHEDGDDPRIPVLEKLLRKMNDSPNSVEVQNIHYHLKLLKRKSLLNDTKTSFWDKALVQFEFIFWGLPTGYGTKLGRILLISLIAWIASIFPILLKRGVLVWTLRSRDGDNSNQKNKGHQGKKIYEPVYWHQLSSGAISPLSIFNRLRVTLAFTLALLYKVPFRGISYVENKKIDFWYGFEIYFFILWLSGSVIMALTGITLATTSPIFGQIIGQIVF